MISLKTTFKNNKKFKPVDLTNYVLTPISMLYDNRKHENGVCTIIKAGKIKRQRRK